MGEGRKAVELHCSPDAHTRIDGSAWSVLVLAEGGTPDQSYFQKDGELGRTIEVAGGDYPS